MGEDKINLINMIGEKRGNIFPQNNSHHYEDMKAAKRGRRERVDPNLRKIRISCAQSLSESAGHKRFIQAI